MALNKSENHGILVRIDWNENKWEQPSGNLEQAQNFGFVRENNISHTSFNFAHDIYETEPDGLWYGLIPAFGSKTPDIDKTRNLKVVFIISKHDLIDYIVGIYTFPKFGNGIRVNKIECHTDYDWINIGSKPSNIVRLENYIKVSDLDNRRSLGDQEIAYQGWNYLSESQVGYIFDSIQKDNPENIKLNKIKFNYLKSIV